MYPTMPVLTQDTLKALYDGSRLKIVTVNHADSQLEPDRQTDKMSLKVIKVNKARQEYFCGIRHDFPNTWLSFNIFLLLSYKYEAHH